MKGKYWFWKRTFAWLFVMVLLFSSASDGILMVKASGQMIQQETEVTNLQTEQDTIEELVTEEKMDVIQEKIADTTGELETVQKEGVSAESSVEETESTIQETESSVEEAESVIQETESSVEEAESVIYEAESSIEEIESMIRETESSVQESSESMIVTPVFTEEEIKTAALESTARELTVTVLCFKDGEVVKECNSEDEIEENLDYEGYVKIAAEGTQREVTVTENTGFEFMILSLIDESGNITTPLSRDYVKSGDGTNQKTNGSYTYTFEVDESKETSTDANTIGSVYQEMPGIKVYFDPEGELVNNDILNCEQTDSKISNEGNSITSWLNTENATLNAGSASNGWGG